MATVAGLKKVYFAKKYKFLFAYAQIEILSFADTEKRTNLKSIKSDNSKVEKIEEN